MSQQRMEALKVANKVRTGISGVKTELAALTHADACAKAADLLETDDPRIMRMRVRWLLTAIPQIGETRAGSYYTAAQINNSDRKVDQLSPRQRGVLAEQLRWRAMETRP